MKNSIYFLLIALLACATASCASAPTTPISLPKDVPLADGGYLDKVWLNRSAISEKLYSGIELSPITAIGVSDGKAVTVDDAKSWLREGFVGDSSRKTPTVGTMTKSVARLNLVVTEIDPGSTAARFWAGELGAGHAWVQVEGTLLGLEDHPVLAYFAHRQRASGVLTLENSRGKDSSPVLIRRMMLASGKKFRKEAMSTLNIEAK